MFNRIARDSAWIIAALTLLLVVLKLVAMAQNLFEAPRYGFSGVTIFADTLSVRKQHVGTITIAINDTASSGKATLFSDCPADGFIETDHPKSGDTLLTIRSLPVTLALWRSEVREHHPAGYTVPITYRHGGEVKTATLILREIGSNQLLIVWGMFVLSFSIALLYLAIGVFTLYKQGSSVQARVLGLLMLALCILVTRILPEVVRDLVHIPLAKLPWRDTLLSGIGTLLYFATAFWLHLAYLFPFPSVFYQKRPRLSLVLCYAPPVMLLPDKLFSGQIEDIGWLGFMTGMAWLGVFIQFFAGIVILWRKRKRATDMLQRRQLKAVFLGAALGPVAFFLPLILVAIIFAIFFGHDINLPETQVVSALLLFLSLAFLPIPISLLYAFRKYRMMEVELKLRRGTRFAVTTGGLLVVFFGLLYGITTLLLHSFSVQSGTAALATGLVLALTFAPVQRRTQRLVERKFFPERNRLRAMLDEMLASASAMPDRATLWESLQSGLRQSLGIAAVVPVFYDELTHTFRRADGQIVPVDADGDLAAKLQTGQPLFVDEMFATHKVLLDEAEVCCLRDQRATVLLPMVIHARLTGFLMLSFAPDQEDVAAEDLAVLASVVSQVALQSENLRLIEENIEKRRLQEQLEMARDVQQRFLPRVMPQTPGLDVAACFRSSLEVAGDYYDIVPLPGGRTLIAVGDVAGKGAGAAMIMANVQASLRSMAHAGVALSAIVSGVNDVLCENTSPDQFVTFFAAIYSPEDHAFTCINAGHNPPRLVHADGSISLLDTGGLCLGVFAGSVYEEETVPVSSGDVLIAFTDGVCEAMNAHDEEFGEERIAELCHNPGASSAQLIETVEQSVIAFHGSSSFEDDFTLLAVRVM